MFKRVKTDRSTIRIEIDRTNKNILSKEDYVKMLFRKERDQQVALVILKHFEKNKAVYYSEVLDTCKKQGITHNRNVVSRVWLSFLHSGLTKRRLRNQPATLDKDQTFCKRVDDISDYWRKFCENYGV